MSRAFPRVELSGDAQGLLVALIEMGSRPFKLTSKPPLRELAKHGYAFNGGNNGTGVTRVTKRGILKALADGLITCHPDEVAPAGIRLDRMRLRDALLN